MPKKKGLPEWNELVLCTVTRITPFAAWCTLDEYETESGSSIEGMIHISEVAGKWVKDIRTFVKQNKQYVAKVVRIDYQKGHLNLSLKRVSKFDKNEKMEEYRRSKRAFGIMMQVSKRIGMLGKSEVGEMEKGVEKVGMESGVESGMETGVREEIQGFAARIEAAYGKRVEVEGGKEPDLLYILEEAKETPAILEEAGIPKDWIEAFKEVMETSFLVKEKTLRANLSITSFEPDGVAVIKRVLSGLERKTGATVKYISAPKYIVDLKSSNLKDDEKKLREGLEKAVEEIKSSGGEGDYKIVKL